MNDELTKVDIQKMQEEIEYRMCTLAPKLKEELARARAHGDLSENYEYKIAKSELNRNYSRVNYLKRMIDSAVVIDADSADDEVGLFDRVTVFIEDEKVEEVYTLVTTLRCDALRSLISKESPVGRALMGHKVGDRVKVTVNDTVSYFVEIRKIEKGEDDTSLEIATY